MNFVNVESIERENDSKKREDDDDLLTLLSIKYAFGGFYSDLFDKQKKNKTNNDDDGCLIHPSNLYPYI